MADYGNEQDDATAVLDLLYAQTEVRTFPAPEGGPSTVPPGTVPPYRSVHFVTSHTPTGQRMAHRSSRAITRVFVHHVGANDIAARALVAKTRAALLDVKPDIAGRSVYPLRNEQTRDADVTEPVAQTTVTITAVYRLETEPGRP